MKHILIDARIINSSTGNYMFNLLENLQDADKKNRYTVLVPPKDVDFWKPRSKRFVIVPSAHKLSSASEQTRLLKQIRSLRPDLVHFTMPQQPAVVGIKRVTTIHDLTPLKFKTPRGNIRKRAVYKLLLRLVARRSSAIITPTEYIKEAVAKFAAINSRKIHVIYNAADNISGSVEHVESLVNKEFILFVGRPAPHKNLDKLIEAFVLLSKDRPELQLVLAGKMGVGYRKLALRAKLRGIDNIVFTGFVSNSQKRWLYENALVYVFPSLSEGFGLPGLEAMAHGCPVASSNATCLPEVYGDAAHYFDPEDVEDMALRINEVLNRKQLRAKLVDLGYAQVKKYSWKKTAEQTLAVYNDVLGSSS